MLNTSRHLLERLAAGWPAARCCFAGGYPCCCRALGSTSSEPPGSTSTSSLTLSTSVCGMCEGALVSQYFRVDLAGIASGSGLCTGSRNCAALNGSYVLGPVGEVTVEGNTFCAAGLEIAGVCRPDDSCFALLRIVFERPTVGDLAGHYLVYVELSSTGDCDEDTGEPVLTFLHDFGAELAPDCVGSFPLTIEGGEIEFIITPKCAAEGASCTITAIPSP